MCKFFQGGMGMNKVIVPEGYKPVLGSYDLQRAIALTKDIFQAEFTQNLQLKRVSAPLLQDYLRQPELNSLYRRIRDLA
jgi:hypothetical protein